MDELTRLGFLAHAQTKPFKRRWQASLEVLLSRLDERSYVSFSAGKDSVVVADMCVRLRPDIPVLMVDPGCPTHWLESERAEWIAFAEAKRWNLTLFPWDKWIDVAGACGEREHRQLAHDHMFADLTAWADARNLDQRVVGLRIEESRGRAGHLRTRGPAGVNADGRRWIAPIAEWSVNDVWAYTVAKGLPWLTIYDHLGPSARNGLIGRSGARHGRLAWLKIHYPDAYQRARELMPLEAAIYV